MQSIVISCYTLAEKSGTGCVKLVTGHTTHSCFSEHTATNVIISGFDSKLSSVTYRNVMVLSSGSMWKCARKNLPVCLDDRCWSRLPPIFSLSQSGSFSTDCFLVLLGPVCFTDEGSDMDLQLSGLFIRIFTAELREARDSTCPRLNL